MFHFVLFMLAPVSCSRSSIRGFSGDEAYLHVQKIVSFGSRLPGSKGSKRARDYIEAELNKLGFDAVKQPFDAKTPIGVFHMTNVIAPIRGSEAEIARPEKIIILGTHYDTKYLKDIPDFVGANDGASGVGILLAMAGVFKKNQLKNSVWMVFFDGEESFLERSQDDWFYGSRHFVADMQAQGRAHSIKAMVLLDMVGDKDFKANYDLNSTKSLLDKTKRIADSMGYGRYFFGNRMHIRDDHIPFLEAGIPAINIIDFEYGGKGHPGAYWHTAQDTLDKVSKKTLKIVGDVAVNLIYELDKEI